MARKFTKISSTAFQEMQIDAGVLLNKFTPASPAVPADEDIICAVSSDGFTASCTPNKVDFGEDVANCPTNTKEFLEIQGYTCQIGFTALSVTEKVVALAVGAADIDGAAHKITPSATLEAKHFTDQLWWVGDLKNGGAFAICLKNALSDGFSFKTGKNSKGQLTVTMVGYVSASNTAEVPMEFYVTTGEE